MIFIVDLISYSKSKISFEKYILISNRNNENHFKCSIAGQIFRVLEIENQTGFFGISKNENQEI